jgi:Fe2+ transport system protein FeoA
MSLWRRLRRRFSRTPAPSLADGCLLGACRVGARATVLCVACPAQDARRLRALGVFVGAQVDVVDTRNGILLDVCGSRLALDSAVAMTITVNASER